MMASDQTTLDVLSKRLRLLDGGDESDNFNELSTTPFFTEPARQRADDLATSSEPVFSQYGLLAGISGDFTVVTDKMLYYNVAAPSSVFICGSQGSGKSHTLSCLLENCLIPTDANDLPSPLAGLVFHYDSSGRSLCEAAFLSSHPETSVRVLCAPTSISDIKELYSELTNVTVEELCIDETDLNTKRMMSLMAVKDGGDMPLYLHVVQRILRDLRLEEQEKGINFNYGKFRNCIESENLTIAQRNPLLQRLDTLESFMPKEQVTSAQSSKRGAKKSKKPTTGNDWTPQPGELTIVDLSCPCVTAEMACSLFDICLSLFLEQPSAVGRVVALDEAHKYMGESAEAGALTAQLLETIRVQRHQGVRVLISTQEPTISPKLLDLCSATIVHRFTSPDWLLALQRHLAGASIVRRLRERAAGDEGGAERPALGVAPLVIADSDPAAALFAHIVRLRVGEALLFAPSAVLGIDDSCNVTKLSHDVLKIGVRKRVTEDGGKSVMAG
ncbi:hypothetical protein GGR52DRAFT_143602 [Hypoxylon sp. FL1284]|nr:hypothetical protein GGR52DRAFT_143602 [Hypoxylon sp. FL1284]